jgi:hypothetical protein
MTEDVDVQRKKFIDDSFESEISAIIEQEKLKDTESHQFC